MNEKVLNFKPKAVTVEIGGETYSLVYDLNAFCELENIYDSVDMILQMILGNTATNDLENVLYKGETVDATDITVAGLNLVDYLASKNPTKQLKQQDTLNLLWAGTLHDHTVYNDDGDVERYTVTKHKLGTGVSFKNLRDINTAIVTSILRDLISAGDEDDSKNGEAQGVE